MKPRLAFCNEDSMRTRGGVSVLVEELIQGLSCDYNIILASLDATEALPGGLLSHIVDHIALDSSAAKPGGIRAFAEQLKDRKVELAHFHLPGLYGWGTRLPGHSPIPLVAKMGIPVITTTHVAQSLLRGYCGDSRPVWERLFLLPRSWLPKTNTLRNVEAEIAVSRRNFEQFRKWFFPFRERFRHIYHSRVRLSMLSPQEITREKAVLAVGHVAFRKGQLILVEAFAKIAARFPDWKLWILGPPGEDECWRRMEQMISQNNLGNRVELLGRRDDPDYWIRRAGVYVQPSYFEGLPLSLQEALAYGCPCIATKINGNCELIENEQNGLLVPPGDATAMSVALARLMENAALRENFSVRGSVSIIEKGMNYESMIQAHKHLYDSILNQKKV